MKAYLLFFAGFFVISISLSVSAQEGSMHGTVSSRKIIDSVKSAANKRPQNIIDRGALKSALQLKKHSADTLKSKLSKKADEYKVSLEKKLQLPSDSLMKEKAGAYASEKLKSGNLPGFKSQKSSSKESPFDFSVENNLLYLTESPLKTGPGFLNNISVAGKFTIAKIPINLDLSSNYNSDSGFEPLQSNLFKFNFDKESMLNSLKSDVEHVTDFKKTFLQGMELPDFTGKAVIGKLRSMPEGKILSSNPAFLSLMRDPEKINELLNLNEKQLKEKVSELVASYKEGLKVAGNQQVTKTKEKFDAKISPIADSIKSIKGLAENKGMLLNSVNNKSAQQKLKTNLTDTITRVIASIKSKLAETGLDGQKVQLVQKIVSGKGDISELESELFRELSKNPKAGKFQSGFSRIREFQTGAFADKLPGSFLNRDIFVKGLNFSVRTQRGPVSLGFGKQNDVGTSKDAGFESSVYSSPRFFSYMSVPTNHSSFGSGKLSWVGSFSRQNEQPGFQSATMGRNSMTFTVSQALTTQNLGKFTIDVSKSASQYNNTLSPGSEHLMLDKSALSNYFSDELFETMAMGLNHDMESKRMNMSSNLYFNYAGVGFQNPGAAGGSNMKMRMGGNLKKKFYNNRLAMSLRADLRNTPVSFSSNTHWQNLQVQVDSRFRISKKSNFTLKYMENGMDKMGEVNTPVYSSRKLQFGGNANFKIAGKYSFSNITLAQQQVFNHQLSSANSNFITLNYLQSLVLKNASVSASLFYNKETSAVKLIGDMFNGDFSCQYSLLKMNITSSVTFLDNKDVARQVGIKQNLQLLAGKHFDISAYADLRKNLIAPLYPDLYAAGRGELSIKYYLKNKF